MNNPFNPLFVIFTLFMIISFQPFLSAQTTCSRSFLSYDSCSKDGPTIDFPFSLKGHDNNGLCKYEGFELSCNNGKTILNLTSGEFIVKDINYQRQAIYINDENFCLPSNIQNFTLLDTPYKATHLRSYKFVNCSSNWIDMHPIPVKISCLSGKNHSVYAVRSLQEFPSYCYEINSSSSQWSSSRHWPKIDRSGNLRLKWTDPRCLYNGDQAGCVGRTTEESRQMMRGALCVFGIALIIGFIFNCYSIIQAQRRLNRDTVTPQRRLNSETVTPQPALTIRTGGLDDKIIESYPKTELGDSVRLPMPNYDSTCPICLLKYQPKDILRSLPQCGHYFHVECIDEWLKINRTCPLCRKSPES